MQVLFYLKNITGVLGIKVKIMLPHDPSGKIGPKKPLPDNVSIVEPKDEQPPAQPYSEQKGSKPQDAVAPPIMA
jgi:small subunit ribosomal protein S3e